MTAAIVKTGSVAAPMLYISTRGGSPAVSISAAIAAGLAPNGGLYVPESLPRLDASAFDPHGTLADTAATLLAPFFAPHLANNYGGLFERMFLGTMLLWIAAISAYMLRRAPEALVETAAR